MRCKKAERLLYLYRNGEITFKEKIVLKNHLASCNRCFAQQQNIGKMIPVITKIQEDISIPKLPEDLTRKILQETEGKISGFKLKRGKMVNRFFIYLLKPRIAFSLIALIFFISGFYFLMEIRILSRITQLEQKVTRLAYNKQILIPTSFPSKVGLTSIDQVEIDTAINLLNKIGPDFLGRDRLVNKRALHLLIKRYLKMNRLNTKLIDKIYTKFPVLHQINYQDGLSSDELNNLFKYKDDFIQFLKNNLKGVKNEKIKRY